MQWRNGEELDKAENRGKEEKNVQKNNQ